MLPHSSIAGGSDEIIGLSILDGRTSTHTPLGEQNSMHRTLIHSFYVDLCSHLPPARKGKITHLYSVLKALRRMLSFELAK